MFTRSSGLEQKWIKNGQTLDMKYVDKVCFSFYWIFRKKFLNLILFFKTAIKTAGIDLNRKNLIFGLIIFAVKLDEPCVRLPT